MISKIVLDLLGIFGGAIVALAIVCLAIDPFGSYEAFMSYEYSK